MSASIALDEPQAEAWIAGPRFAPFLDATDLDHELAVDLYVWNARLASAFFEVIHHLEVFTRNAMHRELRADQQDDAIRSWLLDPAVLQPGQIRLVEETMSRIRDQGRPLTDNRVVGGLSFGFWAYLLGKHYDELWKRTLHRAFPDGSGRRADIAGPFNRVGQLRNNVAHHEAIFTLPIEDRYDDVIAVASAVDAKAGAWLDAVSQVHAVIKDKPLLP